MIETLNIVCLMPEVYTNNIINNFCKFMSENNVGFKFYIGIS